MSVHGFYIKGPTVESNRHQTDLSLTWVREQLAMSTESGGYPPEEITRVNGTKRS